jgi:hypothetical protein
VSPSVFWDSVEGGGLPGKKTPFWGSCFIELKLIILPRHARDKHS